MNMNMIVIKLNENKQNLKEKIKEEKDSDKLNKCFESNDKQIRKIES